MENIIFYQHEVYIVKAFNGTLVVIIKDTSNDILWNWRQQDFKLFIWTFHENLLRRETKKWNKKIK